MNAVARAGRSYGRLWLRFLGSMNLAIALLVGVALASVIGTVLQQNQRVTDYIIKFGPFWHEVFRSLGLYDVYSSLWFLLVLAFLVLSTGVCLTRNSPAVLRSMRDYRERMHRRSLKRMANHAQWNTEMSAMAAASAIATALQRNGYRTRIREDGRVLRVSAMRGASNRLGYIFTHAAIVVICLGGLADGNVPLKFNSLLGKFRVETRDLPVGDIPAVSRLPVDNPSFRASVSIPEGARVGTAFVNLGDGYLAQPLPFTIELKDFRVEHYESGQPKSFQSDLRIESPELEQPLEKTIAVNTPLQFRGYTIYQSSFGDGGSKLAMKAWPLGAPPANAFDLRGAVNRNLGLTSGAEPLQLELTDFRAFNINPLPKDDPSGKKFANLGPSFTFRLRRADGTAREFVNYMLPVEVDGRRRLLSGVRNSPAEEFRYLHIPVDNANSPKRFLNFLHALRQPAAIDAVVPTVIATTVTADARKAAELKPSLEPAIRRLVELFAEGGFEAVMTFVNSEIPAEHRDAAREAYAKMLHAALLGIFRDVLADEGVRVSELLDSADQQFFEDAVTAASALPLYGSPYYIALEDFTEVQASGLQITRTPGKNVVYLGFALLVGGVFLMFYVPHQRIWAIAAPEGNRGAHLLVAGERKRHDRDFARHFAALRAQLSDVLAATVAVEATPRQRARADGHAAPAHQLDCE